MDIKDKLQYYKKSTAPAAIETQQRNEDISPYLDGELLDGIVKIHKIQPVQFVIPGSNNILSSPLFLPVLSKGQFKSEIAWEDLLFFDLETTGLAGGSGTYPFLIGICWIEEFNIHSVQYFLPDYGREAAAFIDMQKIIKSKKILVSYNGKSYDYPLLRNRFILNRFDNFLVKMPHLDLLHLVRRLWKQNLKECSLENVEKKIFHQYRVDDIDGAYIPQAYFDFLSSAIMDDIKRIIGHNFQDLLSLCRLIHLLANIENSPDPRTETARLCQIAANSRDMENATRLFDIASKSEPVPPSMIVSYSLLLKRSGHWSQAVELWKMLLKADGEVLFACEELAKYYEHRKRNLTEALKHTQQALNRFSLLEELELPGFESEIEDRLRHRKARLLNKIRLAQLHSEK